MKRFTYPLCLTTVIVVASSVFAQEQRPRASREEFEGMMEAYVISKLQEALELTDEQFGRMVVAQKKLQDLRREFRRERMELLRDLRQTLRRADAGEDEIGPTLEKLEQQKRAFLEEESARYADIDQILDVRQRARYRILEAEIENRLRELVRQVRERNPGQNPNRPRF